jgi:hypothetical protein
MTSVEMVLIGSESQKVLHHSKLTVKEAGPRAEPWVPTEGGLSYSPWPGPGDSEGGGWGCRIQGKATPGGDSDAGN